MNDVFIVSQSNAGFNIGINLVTTNFEQSKELIMQDDISEEIFRGVEPKIIKKVKSEVSQFTPDIPKTIYLDIDTIEFEEKPDNDVWVIYSNNTSVRIEGFILGQPQ